MIELKNLFKNYGKTVALNDFSIKIEEPAIYCLLGRNGAGKTTFLKTVAGQLEPTEGKVLVNGKKIGLLKMPESVHYLDSTAVQFNMKLKNLFASARDVNPSFEVDFALMLATEFKLVLTKRYRHLSFGMKTMVNVIIALASGRDILLLDEPVLGFDPVMRKTFYDLLHLSQTIKPKIIIISTHIIDEIAKVAERLIIIEKGQLIIYCGMDEIDAKAYAVTGLAASVIEATKNLNVLSETKAGGFLSRNVFDKRIEESDKYSISSISLQDFFVGLVGENAEE